MLRAKLSWITKNSWFYSTLTSRIEDLRSSTGHTIQILSSEDDDLGYNCVAYALGLAEQPLYRAISEQWRSEGALADTQFVQHLIGCSAMVERNDWADGLLGVYFQEQSIAHIGRFVSDSRLRSKWGGGLLYEHGAFEVPQEYGGRVRAFSIPDQAAALDRFVAFADAKRENIRCGATNNPEEAA